MSLRRSHCRVGRKRMISRSYVLITMALVCTLYTLLYYTILCIVYTLLLIYYKCRISGKIWYAISSIHLSVYTSLLHHYNKYYVITITSIYTPYCCAYTFISLYRSLIWQVCGRHCRQVGEGHHTHTWQSRR